MVLDSSLKPTVCRQRRFNWGERTFVMGIVNLSPDSFSGDGLRTIDAAVEQAKRFVAEGADIIDIGGESTRPNAQPVTIDEEIARLVPAIEKLGRELSVPISVDSYKYDVVKETIRAGAHIINDVWGLKREPRLAVLAAEYNLPIILTSNQRDNPCKGDIMAELLADLKHSIGLCKDAGVTAENIIIDPGIGFGKTVEQNLEIIRRLVELKVLGKPILLGTSRKSFIGLTLDLPAGERLEGTAATNAIGIANGADIIRVHDVKFMSRVAKMSDGVIRRKTQ
jgi:dihydropteroate synthase